MNSFTLRQLEATTNNFDIANKIGEGGFGAVYKVPLSFTVNVSFWFIMIDIFFNHLYIRSLRSYALYVLVLFLKFRATNVFTKFKVSKVFLPNQVKEIKGLQMR